jgi:hypothetical protein
MVTRTRRQASIAKPKGRVARFVRLLREVDDAHSQGKGQTEDRA